MIYRGQGNVICILNQGLYKDIRSCGRSAGSTRLVGVFDFPILKFVEGKFATGVAFCHKGSVFGKGGGGYIQAVSLPSGSFSK